jgi:hypothetical protein
MPISKKQNKSRKHFSRINKNKSKLTKNLNDKKSKKTKLQISKLSGGAGRDGIFNNLTLKEKLKLVNNNMSNISKFKNFELSEIENKITNTEKEISKIKRIIKSNRTRNNPEYKEESGYDKYKIYLNILKGYKKLKTPQSRFSKIFKASPKPPVAPRKLRNQNVKRNSESPINAWEEEEEYENYGKSFYHNPSAQGEREYYPPIPEPFSKYVEKQENVTNEPEDEKSIFGVPSTSTNTNSFKISKPNKEQKPAQEIIYMSSNNVNTQNFNNSNNSNNPNNSNIYTVANVNTPIKRLEKFIQLLTYISFCDCKIILLYILAYRLYEDEKQKIIKLINQDTIKKSLRQINKTLQYNSKLIDNTYLIWNTLQIIIKILNIKYIGDFKSCSDMNLKDYLNSDTKKDPNKTNYKILFNTVKNEEYENIVNTLSTIFKQGGNFIEGIDIENINGNIFKKSSKKQSLSLAKGENIVLAEKDFEA